MARKKPKNPVMKIKPYNRLTHLQQILIGLDKDSDEYRMVKDEIDTYRAGERFGEGGSVKANGGFGTSIEYYKDMY